MRWGIFTLLFCWNVASGQDALSSRWELPTGDSVEVAGERMPVMVWPRALVDSENDWSASIEPRVAWRDVPEAGAVNAPRGGWVGGLRWARHAGRWDFDFQGSHTRVGGAAFDLWDEAWRTGGASGAGRASTPDPNTVHLLRLWAEARFRLSPSMELALGNTPMHWGAGWRSLWIDRQAGPMPHLTFHVDGGRVRYTKVLGLASVWGHGTMPLTDPNLPLPAPGRYRSWEPTWMAAQLVEVDLGRGFHGALFGAVKWLHRDTAHAQRFEWAYALPMVSFRPTEYMLGSADNALVGLSGGWRAARRAFGVEGAVVFDEFVRDEMFSDRQWWANKWGAQLTLRGATRDDRWAWLAEVVAVRPFTYGHAGPGTAWVTGNAPLAHPAGANFIEQRAHLRFRHEHWRVTLGGFYRRQGVDVDLPRYSFDAPETTTGANPLVSYGARPADYGIGWLTTGQDGALERGFHVWSSVSRNLPRLPGNAAFARVILLPDGSKRFEIGLTTRRVWEERIW